MLQVEILLVVERATVILPTGLPGYQSGGPERGGIGACIVAKIPELQLQFRMHDYYMGECHWALLCAQMFIELQKCHLMSIRLPEGLFRIIPSSQHILVTPSNICATFLLWTVRLVFYTAEYI